jgi:NAD(P)-dependent dehydrogenase (short-subunit alcohol dehydrogenase family)
VLGEAGATVYVTGRSLRGSTTENMKGSIEETAEAVSALGGHGIAVRCNHTVDGEVEALFSRVKDEKQGRLDLLINNAWGGYEQYEFARFTLPMRVRDAIKLIEADGWRLVSIKGSHRQFKHPFKNALEKDTNHKRR